MSLACPEQSRRANPDHLELADLEWFIELGGLVGYKQFGFTEIRARQDAELTEQLRQRALARIGDRKQIEVTDDSFFLGSVDYMVRETPDGQLGYTVLETNGGSSRGLTLLAPPDVERLMGGFVEMLRFLDDDEPPFIIVGHIDNDTLITEKFLTAYRLKEALEKERPGLRVRILSIDSFSRQRRSDEAVIVLSPHSQSARSLHLREDKVYLLGRRVHLIIGDGVVARHHELGHQRANVVLANWIFPYTGDKFSTYQAIERAREILVPHGVYPLRFWRAWDRDELVEKCEAGLSEVDGLVIKPFQGSGGAGVLPLLEDSSVPEVVENSLGEFHAKYGHRNTPFPYTVCEKINPRKAIWRGNRHNYDIRIYVARQGDMLIPVGCLFRLAPQPDKGTYSKGSLIVNLSAYGGIAVERGLGLIQESLDIVRLEEEDIVKIFAASTLLMAAITHQPIDWSQREPQ
jgi:hypothetical protein